MLTNFSKEDIRDDLPGLVVLSHGPMAIGILESAKMITGDLENTAAFCYEFGDDDDALARALAEAIETFPAGSILLFDVFGGSPCNTALRYLHEAGLHPPMVSGVNVPMLLELANAREFGEYETLAAAAAQAGKEGIKNIWDRLGM